MARYLNNRSTDEIAAFLAAHGFRCTHTKGDDDIFVKSGYPRTVKVTKNRKCTPIGTMSYIKKMSGYNIKEWVGWWKENGFGE